MHTLLSGGRHLRELFSDVARGPPKPRIPEAALTQVWLAGPFLGQVRPEPAGAQWAPFTRPVPGRESQGTPRTAHSSALPNRGDDRAGERRPSLAPPAPSPAIKTAHCAADVSRCVTRYGRFHPPPPRGPPPPQGMGGILGNAVVVTLHRLPSTRDLRVPPRRRTPRAGNTPPHDTPWRTETAFWPVPSPARQGTRRTGRSGERERENRVEPAFQGAPGRAAQEKPPRHVLGKYWSAAETESRGRARPHRSAFCPDGCGNMGGIVFVVLSLPPPPLPPPPTAAFMWHMLPAPDAASVGRLPLDRGSGCEERSGRPRLTAAAGFSSALTPGLQLLGEACQRAAEARGARGEVPR
ncbi:hypothetical protein SKAU_G00003880 [Synaphobranchus kaupii]|uniref:Uncharacterized protein n=1 Tax=Synaphobranchus kaupii TaxID=118154 RepID=A0A9Q1G8S5_SYNKA|nr:hypothetical protein SKAU_G00003880 [Synaphobranchus kaupii]